MTKPIHGKPLRPLRARPVLVIPILCLAAGLTLTGAVWKQTRPHAIVDLGLLLTFLATGLAFYGESGRQSARVLVDRRAKELREADAQCDEVNRRLREASHFQEVMLDRAAHAIFTVTPGGLIRSFNPAAERLLGYTAAEIVGKMGLTTFHDPDEMAARAPGAGGEPGFALLVGEALRRCPGEQEWTYLRKDGARVPVGVSITALWDEGGGLTGYLGMAVDISARKQAEEKLQLSEAFNRSILDSVSAEIAVLDPGGTIVAVNESWRRFALENGPSPGEPVPHTGIGTNYLACCRIDTDCSSHRDAANARLAIQSVLEGKVSQVTLEYPCHSPKEKRWFNLSVTPLGSQQQGEHQGVVVSHTNITLRKVAERAILDAKEAAEAATEAKSSFLAMMSHEIRTPLNGLLGFTHLLLDSSLTEAQRQYVQIIEGSGQNLMTVINDILDYSKVEAGKLELEAIAYDLEQAAYESLELLAGRAEEKRLTLALTYAADAPRRLKGDPGRVRQVLLNLAGNALKFTSTGHVLVSVSRAPAPAHQPGLGRVRVAVTDTGVGVPKEKQAALFHKFSQADSSTTRRFGGTGLGLAICRQLVELMGGQIGIDSAAGIGSTFWFTLPETDPGDAAEPDETEARWAKARMLIADPVEINRRVLQAQLASWGVEHEAVSDGATALARLREARSEGRPFQIALLDEGTPEMGVEKLGAAIRNDPELNALSLIAITGNGQRGESSLFLEAGFGAHLAKPLVRIGTLTKALDAAWDDRQVRLGLQSPKNASAAPVTPPSPGIRNAAAAEHRVLVVEDTVVNQTLAKHLLGRLGCRVDLAANGLEAVEMTNQFDYDLVLMDCHMPEMDGFEATRAIRQREHERERPMHLPIVALTASAMQEERAECLDAGMDDFIPKPFLPHDLEQALERWSQAPQRAEAGKQA